MKRVMIATKHHKRMTMAFGILSVASTLGLSACYGESDSSGHQDQSSHQSTGGTSSQDWLDNHNKYRQDHQVANLQWSEELAQKAQAYANTCPDGHSNLPYGENMAYASDHQTAADVVKRWYVEESEYDYNTPRFSMNTGHFTQVVWKATTHIGCAEVSNCSGKWKSIAVCEYSPSGNVSGQFADNVFAKK